MDGTELQRALAHAYEYIRDLTVVQSQMVKRTDAIFAALRERDPEFERAYQAQLAREPEINALLEARSIQKFDDAILQLKAE
jgi:hypothetical protein